MRVLLMSGGAVLAAALALVAGDALAANPIQKECAAKYQAAKAANTLNGMKYNDYYRQCAAAAKAGAAPAAAPAAPATPAPAPTAAPAAPPPAPAPTAAPAPAPSPSTTRAAAKPAPAPSPPASAAGVVFPTAIAPQFSTLKAGDARRKTCAAQWHANKPSGANGTLRWPQFYSQCNTRLKG